MRHALKEWSIVCDALASGEQAVLLRKGGIVEGTGEFLIEQPRFLLFPSTFHPAPELLRPEARGGPARTGSAPSGDGVVRIAAWAEAVASRPVESEAEARRLAAWTIYTADCAAERFLMQKHRTLHLVLVRAYRLAAPVHVPLRPEYAGCTSWVELAAPIDTAGSTPALDRAAFARLLAELAPAPTGVG